MRKKILLRASGILPPLGEEYIQGIGRSNMELLKQFMALNDSEIEITFYCNQIKRPLYKFSEWKFKHYWNILPNKLNLYSKIEYYWRKIFTRYDLFHITDNYAVVGEKEKFVATIHDMSLYYEQPRSQPLFHHISEKSIGIITCSMYTKSEIIRILGTAPSKISVIPWGIDHTLFYPRTEDFIEAVKRKFHICGNYFFSCSCAHPRKNTRDVIESFSIFCKNKDGISLVLAWGNPPIDIRIKYENLISSNKLYLLDYVTDDELAALYSGALASFLVSSLEGFGFPIIESMACGTPCVTCDNSSLKEIGADKAYFVQEHNILAIVDAMKHFYKTGKILDLTLVDYSNKFSWKATAQAYLDFYKRVTARPSQRYTLK